MSDSAIHAALIEMMLDWVDRPDTVVWDGDPGEPTVGIPWAREVYVPGTRRAVTLGETPVIQHVGIYFVDLFVPVAEGLGAGEALADSLLLHFNPRAEGTYDGVTVQIEDSQRDRALVEPGWIMIPCRIDWLAYTMNPI